MFASLLSDAELVLTWLAHAAWQAGLLAMVVLTLTWLLGRPASAPVAICSLADCVRPPCIAGPARSVVECFSDRFACQPAQAAAVVDSSSTLPGESPTARWIWRPDDLATMPVSSPRKIHKTFTSRRDRRPVATSTGMASGKDTLLTQLAVLIWIAGVAFLSLPVSPMSCNSIAGNATGGKSPIPLFFPSCGNAAASCGFSGACRSTPPRTISARDLRHRPPAHRPPAKAARPPVAGGTAARAPARARSRSSS